jgi:hypothetical protein
MNIVFHHARIIILITAVRLLALDLQSHLMAAFTYNDFVNLIYLPAGISTMALLIFSYPAAIGTFCGSFIWTFMRRDFSIPDTLIYACASAIAVTAAYTCVQLYLKRSHRQLSWSDYTLPLLASYFIINAAFNSVLRAIGINSIIVTAEPTLSLIGIKFIGDVSGAAVLFITLNLLAIIYLRLRTHAYKP